MTATEARTSSENVTLRFCNQFLVIQSRYSWKTVLELNWNKRLGHKKTKLNICHHMLTSSTQLQNRSFHVRRKNENVFKMSKDEICTCKACKNTVFHCQICKFVGLLLLSSSWLLKLPFKNWLQKREVTFSDDVLASVAVVFA